MALLGLLALAGCGFAPVYQDSTGLREQISFRTDDSVAGYRIQEALERRLGLAGAPAYLLTVSQSQSRDPAAINSDGDTVRYNIIGQADWVLRAIDSSATVAKGQETSFAAYAATGSTVATQAAEADAVARLATALADQIVGRLLVLTPELAQ